MAVKGIENTNFSVRVKKTSSELIERGLLLQC